METKGRITSITPLSQATWQNGEVHNQLICSVQIGIREAATYDWTLHQEVVKQVPEEVKLKLWDQQAETFAQAGWQVGDVVKLTMHIYQDKFDKNLVKVDNYELVKKAQQPVQGNLGKSVAQQPVVAQMPAPQPSQAPVAQGPVDDLPF